MTVTESSGEFDLIRRYFQFSQPQDCSVITGIGDDAAIVTPSATAKLAISVDTLISGRHFPVDSSAADIAYKSLAVNLSDMAAMGATPKWFTLSIAMPVVDHHFLQLFSYQLQTLAMQYHVTLIGGDTVRGQLAITIQIIGELPAGAALRRDGAQVGDTIFVSGTLGDAAAGLFCWQSKDVDLSEAAQRYLQHKLHRPLPRCDLGQQLLSIATAAIDISDGLLADLGHILQQSGVGAIVHWDKLPLSTSLQNLFSKQQQQKFALSGGDDYELCFTVASDKIEQLQKLASTLNYRITPIGAITAEPEMVLQSQTGPTVVTTSGFDHFAQP